MVQNINHILEKITRFKKWGPANMETKEYIKNNEVGFKVSESSTMFISTKRHGLNYDWELKYDEIIGISFVEKMVFDNEEQQLIFYLKKKKPIRFTLPLVTSEEILGMKNFLNKLNELYDLGHFRWVQDKAVLAYPNHLKGKELHGNWKGFIIGNISRLAKFLGLKYKYEGALKRDLIERPV